MKTRNSIRTVFAICAVLSSTQVFAAPDSVGVMSTDESMSMERPIVPLDFDIVNLPSSNNASRQHTTDCYASYMIQKTGPNHVRSGDSIPFQIAITNIGNCYLTGLRIVDFFPMHTSFHTGWPTPTSVSSDRVFWNLSSLSVNEIATFNVDMTLNTVTTSQWITNTACVWNAMVGQRACAWTSTWSSPAI